MLYNWTQTRILVVPNAVKEYFVLHKLQYRDLDVLANHILCLLVQMVMYGSRSL